MKVLHHTLHARSCNHFLCFPHTPKPPRPRKRPKHFALLYAILQLSLFWLTFLSPFGLWLHVPCWGRIITQVSSPKCHHPGVVTSCHHPRIIARLVKNRLAYKWAMSAHCKLRQVCSQKRCCCACAHLASAYHITCSPLHGTCNHSPIGL